MAFSVRVSPSYKCFPVFYYKIPSWICLSSPLVNLLNPVETVLRPDFAFVQAEKQIPIEKKNPIRCPLFKVTLSDNRVNLI